MAVGDICCSYEERVAKVAEKQTVVVLLRMLSVKVTYVYRTYSMRMGASDTSSYLMQWVRMQQSMLEQVSGDTVQK